MIETVIYFIAFLFGMLIGSFLNVCIFRIPEKRNIAIGRSHCMGCNHTLTWYELIPIFSFIGLRGKCRSCKAKLSLQYPMIEAVNALLYVLVFYTYGWSGTYVIVENILLCFALSTLLVVSMIDLKTKTIPNGINVFFVLLALVRVGIRFLDTGSFSEVLPHVIGFFSISLFLLILFYATQGRGIGGGDVKLMAGAGLLLGWKLVLLAFFLGCLSATVIYFIRRMFKKVDRVLAFGPYLALGIAISLLYGNELIDWYINTFFYY